jgi:hypothetical protein
MSIFFQIYMFLNMHWIKAYGTLATLKLFLSLDNKGARGPQVTKQDARDSVTVAMLWSMPRNAEKVKQIFFLGTRTHARECYVYQERRRGSWPEKTCWGMPGFLFFCFVELCKRSFLEKFIVFRNNLIFWKKFRLLEMSGKTLELSWDVHRDILMGHLNP